MFHIIYLSSAAVPFSPDDLAGLLEKSRINNASLGVTGLLLYKDGNFLQVMEGEESTVETLFAKIGCDRRHRGILVLFKENIPRRDFANWSMAFRNLDSDPGQLPDGFNELLNINWSEVNLAEYPDKVRTFMKMFSN